MKITFSKMALKQLHLIKANKVLCKNVFKLLAIIEADPFKTPPFYEKLSGDLLDMYSRRINIKHRLIYTVDLKNDEVKVLSMWSHYETV